MPRIKRRDPDRRKEKRENRRDWLREKWEQKPRKLLDLITASTGLIKWLLIAVAAFYALSWGLGFDLSFILNWLK